MANDSANDDNANAVPDAVWDELINKPASPEPQNTSSKLMTDADVTEMTTQEGGTSSDDFTDTHDDAFAELSGGVMDTVELKIDEALNQIQKIKKNLESRSQQENYKDTIIERLHQELQQYKDDILKKQIRPIIMDLIQFMDNIRKLTDFYKTKGLFDQDPEKLLKFLIHIPADLEDICGRNGVFSFQCDQPVFSPTRQRILKRIVTHEPTKDKVVAKSIRPGYEWDGEVIRPEMVAIYVYKEADSPGEIDE